MRKRTRPALVLAVCATLLCFSGSLAAPDNHTVEELLMDHVSEEGEASMQSLLHWAIGTFLPTDLCERG
jgi:hypothetical protein